MPARDLRGTAARACLSLPACKSSACPPTVQQRRQHASRLVSLLLASAAPAGLRGLIFSGDHDMAVPHTGSEAWTAWLVGAAGPSLACHAACESGCMHSSSIARRMIALSPFRLATHFACCRPSCVLLGAGQRAGGGAQVGSLAHRGSPGTHLLLCCCCCCCYQLPAGYGSPAGHVTGGNAAALHTLPAVLTQPVKQCALPTAPHQAVRVYISLPGTPLPLLLFRWRAMQCTTAA